MKLNPSSFLALSSGLVLATGALLTSCSREPSPSLPPPSVRVAVAVRETSARQLRLTGEIEPDRTTYLSFAVAGTVEEVLVSEGNKVVHGQPLARLNQRSYLDAVAIAQAQVDLAQDAWNRLEPLHRNKTIPDVKWVATEIALRQATSALSIAQKNLEDTTLAAPETGIIAKRNVELGATVAPGIPVLTLVQNRTVLATAPMPEKYISEYKAGQRADVSVAALNRGFEGTIREVGVIADPLTRTYKLKIEVPNPEEQLRLGMVADIFLQQGSSGGRVIIPAEAVRLDDAGNPCVYLVNADHSVFRRTVEMAGYSGEMVAISRGVSIGDRVVISGTPMLANGVHVQVLSENQEN